MLFHRLFAGFIIISLSLDPRKSNNDTNKMIDATESSAWPQPDNSMQIGNQNVAQRWLTASLLLQISRVRGVKIICQA